MALEFLLLGPLEVRRNGTPVAIPAAMQRSLLACLLLEANRPVPVETLAARLWTSTPPRDVRATMRSYVMRLRRALDEDRIETRDRGYLINVGEDELDLVRFKRLANQAHTEPDTERAAQLWHAAVRLWRGDPLANIPCESLHRDFVPALTEQRLVALECRIDCDLRLGRHVPLIAELRQIIQSHPLRERFWAQLMLAQYRSSRQAESLDTYRALDVLLRTELGIEPSPELRELHRAMLSGEVATSDHREQVELPVPAQLPADVYGFTGRLDCLDRLDELESARSSGVVVGALTGTAGAGKTALAVRWAHRVRSRFPHGQLYLDLCGYGPQPPLEPAEALAWLLRSLGAAVPQHLSERAALFRSLVDQRRMLLMLDNASSAEQVRPLLPGTSSCMVLVTSRDSLSGLVARDGARRVDVGLLSQTEAFSLLRTLIGERVDDEPEAANSLADRCARLPLALRVAAESAIARPGTRLAKLARTLADDQPRTQVLTAGEDAHSAVNTVFSWSIGKLRPDVARAFKLLGCCPGRTFDHYAIAALNGAAIDTARTLAEGLIRAHLIERGDGERFQMHDLLRSYAVELAMDDGFDDERSSALKRLLDYQNFAVATAMNEISPFERHYRPIVDQPATPTPMLSGHNVALRWLDDERANLLTSGEVAASYGFPRATVLSFQLLQRYLDTAGHFDEGARLGHLALAATRESADRASERFVLSGLGLALFRLGDTEVARGQFQQELEIAREVGDPISESRALNNLALVDGAAGDYLWCLELELDALKLDVAVGDRFGECRTRINLAATYQRMGELDKAREHGHLALAIAEVDGNQIAATRALNNLGFIDLEVARYDEALQYFRRGLDLTYPTGDRALRGYLLSNIGTIHARTGDFAQAALEQRQAHTLARQVGDHGLQASTLNALGELARRIGQAGQALDHYRQALALAKRIDNRRQVSRSHGGMAHTYLDLGERDEAQLHRQEAEHASAELGIPIDKDLAARFDQSG